MSPNRKAEDIEAAAAAWFERREWTDWDAASAAAFEEWLTASTAHRIAFVRLEAAWERAERLKVLGAGVPPGRVPARASFGFEKNDALVLPIQATAITMPVLHDKGSSARRFRWTLGLSSVAASLALVAWYQSTTRWQAYGTPVGTIAPVALADGSRITLDSDTRIQVDLEASQRLVRIDHGKALFDVAKDTARPMIVEVADKRVTAVGTEFLVQRDADDITVLVKEGRVRMEGKHPPLDSHPIELAAGNKMSTTGQMTVEQLDANEVQRALSWREGYLEFQNTPLSQAVTEFNRYRTQKIEIEDARINSLRIGGRFRCTDGDAFLSLLQQGFPVVVTLEGNHVGLHRR